MLPERQLDLPPEQMGVVGGCGAVGHDHVVAVQLLHGELRLLGGEVLGVVTAQLQEPLRPAD